METAPSESGTISGIRFCERCKQSVPEAEFHDGRALRVGAKHVHVDCLMKRSLVLPVLALLLGLYGAGVGTVLLLDRVGASDGDRVSPAVERRIARAAQDAEERAVRAAGQAAPTGVPPARVDRLEASIQAAHEQVKARLAAMEAQAAAQRDEVRAALAKAPAGPAAGDLAAIQQRLEALAALEGKFDRLSEALAEVRQYVAAQREAEALRNAAGGGGGG
jgi:hypothetical protein